MLLLLGLLVAVACGWGGYEYGRYAGGFDVREARKVRAEQRARIAELERRNRDLLTENARARRGAQVDRDAHAAVSVSLGAAEREMLEVHEELAFYRSIVAPGEMSPGLHLQRLHLTPGEAGRYSYELVLTQAQRSRHEARGSIDMRISGQLGERRVTYALVDVSEGGSERLNFKFKYFQSFEGGLRLPEGYRPESVTVIIEPEGDKLKAVRKTLQWPEVLFGGS